MCLLGGAMQRARGDGSRQASMLTFESYGGAIQRGQSLQSLACDLVIEAIASSIRMQHQYAASIGLLEFGQLAIGLYTKNSVEVKEIGFTSQVHTPLEIRPVLPR